MLEQDYLKDSAAYNFKDDRSKALNEYSSQLIREFIIPKLTKEVNTSKRYASLRQVYYSLILSRWFKSRFAEKKGLSPKGTDPSFISLIDSQNLTNLTSQDSWTKDTNFQAYKKSFTEGEYNIKESVYTPTGQVIRSYMSGGINAGPILTIATENGFRIAGSPVGIFKGANASRFLSLIMSTVGISGFLGKSISGLFSSLRPLQPTDLQNSDTPKETPEESITRGMTEAKKAVQEAIVIAEPMAHNPTHAPWATLGKLSDAVRILYLIRDKLSDIEFADFQDEINKLIDSYVLQFSPIKTHPTSVFFISAESLRARLMNSVDKVESTVNEFMHYLSAYHSGQLNPEMLYNLKIITGAYTVNIRRGLPDEYEALKEQDKPLFLISHEGNTLYVPLAVGRIIENRNINENDYKDMFAAKVAEAFFLQAGLNKFEQVEAIRLFKNNYASLSAAASSAVKWDLFSQYKGYSGGTHKYVVAVDNDGKAVIVNRDPIYNDYGYSTSESKVGILSDITDILNKTHEKVGLQKVILMPVFDEKGIIKDMKYFGIGRDGQVSQHSYGEIFDSGGYGTGRYKWYGGVDERVSETLASASPMTEKGKVTPGGIDFKDKAMSNATTYKPMGSFEGLNFTLPFLSKVELDNIDLAKEVEHIKKLVSSGIMPEPEFTKKVMAAAKQTGKLDMYLEDFVVAFANICEWQEQNDPMVELPNGIKEAMVIVDSVSI